MQPLTTHTRLSFLALRPDAREHELTTQRAIAERLAALLGCTFEGQLDPSVPVGAMGYLVPNDTITSIARKHDTTERSIGYWNRDEHPTLDPESSRYNPNDIRVGWTLLLIPGVEVDPDEITPPPTARSAPSAPSGSAEAGD